MNQAVEDINHMVTLEEVWVQISIALSLSIVCLNHFKKCAPVHTFFLKWLLVNPESTRTIFRVADRMTIPYIFHQPNLFFKRSNYFFIQCFRVHVILTHVKHQLTFTRNSSSYMFSFEFQIRIIVYFIWSYLGLICSGIMTSKRA